MSIKRLVLFFGISLPVLLPRTLNAEVSVEASPPQGATISVYDTGMAIINESRRASLPLGDARLVLGDIPVEVEPDSITIGSVARTAPFELLTQEMRYDMKTIDSVLGRLVGQPLVLQLDGQPREGVLISGSISPEGQEGDRAISIRSRDGKNVWLVGLQDLSAITFPFSKDLLASAPEAIWRIRSRQEGPQNFRVSYRARGMEWKAHYDLLLDENSQQGDLSVRVGLLNRSGGRFENARLRLLESEKGMAVPAAPVSGGGALPRSPLVYGYGSDRPELEQLEAGVTPIRVYELPRTVTLENGREHYISMIQSAGLPLQRFFVYDGVRFDRFQRNPRTDWNYGTEFRSDVQKHIEFENAEKFGLGVELPSGLCRVYQVRADGAVDVIGESYLANIGKGERGAIRVGPAVGLRGERERTGYVEVKPHREYEESFEIRLQNSSDEVAEVRVVEHLYRGSDFEIVRTDADYTKTGPQSIEFRVELKPAARRSIHYTVRYLW